MKRESGELSIHHSVPVSSRVSKSKSPVQKYLFFSLQRISFQSTARVGGGQSPSAQSRRQDSETALFIYVLSLLPEIRGTANSQTFEDSVVQIRLIFISSLPTNDLAFWIY